MCKHTGCGCTHRSGPVVLHEAELVRECVEFVRSDRHVGTLRSVVQHGLVDRIREALAAGQGHDEVVVHAPPGDQLVDDTALVAALVFGGVQQFGVDPLVDDHVGDLHIEMALGQGVLHCPDFLSQHGLELALAHPVTLDDEPPRLEAVELLEAFEHARHAAGDLRTQFFLHVLHLDFARLLAEVLVETCSEAHDAASVAVPHVHSTHHRRDVGALWLQESPGRAVVEFGDHLRQELADDAGRALATGQRTGEHDLRGDGQLTDRQPLGQFVEVQVVFLAATSRHDEQDEVCVLKVAHVLQPLLCVAPHFQHDGFVHLHLGALASTLEFTYERVLGVHVVLVALQRENGPLERIRMREHSALRLSVEHRLVAQVVLELAPEGNAAGMHASPFDVRQERLALVVEHQPDAILVEQLPLLAEHRGEELLVLADAEVLLEFELHELHHEAACPQLVVESGLSAELGHQLDGVGLAAASTLLLRLQDRLVLGQHLAVLAFFELLLLGDFAGLVPSPHGEAVLRAHVEFDVGDLLGLGGVVVCDDVAPFEALDDGVAQVAFVDLLAHLVHGLEHSLVEVDLLRGVDFDEDALLAFVFAHVDGRTLAGQDADALLGVDLLFRVDVEELAPDLRQPAVRLRAVEDVVEEDFLEADGVAGVVRSRSNRLGLVFVHGSRSRLHDALGAHQLGAEEHVLP